MLIAPSVMGKTAIINKATQLHDQFSRVKSFTTRAPRPDDAPELYFYLTPQELEAKRQAGDVVSAVVFPTTGHTYGTLRESFTGQYCLQDTLANSVDTYRALPFADTKSIAIISPLEQWRERFLARYPTPTTEARDRLDEAVFSLSWCIYDPQVTWLLNDGTLDEAATKLISMVTEGDNHVDSSQVARDILAAIKTGLY